MNIAQKLNAWFRPYERPSFAERRPVSPKLVASKKGTILADSLEQMPRGRMAATHESTGPAQALNDSSEPKASVKPCFSPPISKSIVQSSPEQAVFSIKKKQPIEIVKKHIETLQTQIPQHPINHLLALGLCLLYIGDDCAALRAFHSVLDADPANRTALLYRCLLVRTKPHSVDLVLRCMREMNDKIKCKDNDYYGKILHVALDAVDLTNQRRMLEEIYQRSPHNVYAKIGLVTHYFECTLSNGPYFDTQRASELAFDILQKEYSKYVATMLCYWNRDFFDRYFAETKKPIDGARLALAIECDRFSLLSLDYIRFDEHIFACLNGPPVVVEGSFS